MSTLAELESALRRELASDELLDLEEDFYSKARKLLNDIRRAQSESAGASRVIEERIRETIEKLFLFRLKKELEHLLRYGEIPKKSIPQEERQVLISINKILSAITQTSIKEGKTSGEGRAPKSGSPTKLSLVVFRKPYSKILLSEKGVLGPFAPGDVAIVPEAVANELKRSQVLEVIADFET